MQNSKIVYKYPALLICLVNIPTYDTLIIIIIIIIIHQKLAEAAELMDDKSPYYKHTPANVLENENFKLCCNRSILTDKTIPFNPPDINL